jgi:hypothetical protein
MVSCFFCQSRRQMHSIFIKRQADLQRRDSNRPLNAGFSSRPAAIRYDIEGRRLPALTYKSNEVQVVGNAHTKCNMIIYAFWCFLCLCTRLYICMLTCRCECIHAADDCHWTCDWSNEWSPEWFIDRRIGCMRCSLIAVCLFNFCKY